MLSVCFCAYRSVYLAVHLSDCLPASLPFRLSVHQTDQSQPNPTRTQGMFMPHLAEAPVSPPTPPPHNRGSQIDANLYLFVGILIALNHHLVIVKWDPDLIPSRVGEASMIREYAYHRTPRGNASSPLRDQRGSLKTEYDCSSTRKNSADEMES